MSDDEGPSLKIYVVVMPIVRKKGPIGLILTNYLDTSFLFDT